MDPNKRMTAMEALNHSFLRINEVNVQYDAYAKVTSIEDTSCACDSVTACNSIQTNPQVLTNESSKVSMMKSEHSPDATTMLPDTLKRYTYV
jgi:hypothetical protein